MDQQDVNLERCCFRLFRFVNEYNTVKVVCQGVLLNIGGFATCNTLITINRQYIVVPLKTRIDYSSFNL